MKKKKIKNDGKEEVTNVSIKDGKGKIKKEKIKKPKEKRNIWKSLLNGILVFLILMVSLFLVFMLYIVITAPDFKKDELYQTEPTILYDKYGDELARVGSEDSTVISYDEFPTVLIDALIATEDSRFFQHNGLDLYRFTKTIASTLMGSKDAGGASTLSMQVIKNTYTQKGNLEKSKSESIVRKFKDIYMAVFKLEANYTKEEIIEFYLNSQWLANSASINTAGTYGVERASQVYFGKSVKDINLAEASLMVGMFQNPRLYNPYRNPEGCRNRQRTVLKLLVRHGYITEDEMNSVLKIPIESMLVTKTTTNASTDVESNQAFIDYVINEVNEDLGLNARNASLKIYTTFDPKIQKTLEKIEEGGVYKYPDEAMQEGIAVTSVTDGSIVALSGGRGYQAMGTNRSTDISRQPGSTAKPIMDYAMYIEHISQSTYAMFLDEPYTYSNGQKITNYDNGYKGLITMRYAIQDSRNIPALQAFQAVYKKDPKYIIDFAHSVGIDYGDDLFESAAIGGFTKGVSPLEMAAAYATFGRGGYYIEPYSYTKVINNMTGEEINHSYTKTQVLEASTAFMINNLLVSAYTGSKPSGTQVAGKTGTTNLDKDTKNRFGLPTGAVMDSWFITYSPSYSIALWVGYDKIEADSAEKKHYMTGTIRTVSRRTLMNELSSKIHKKGESFKTPKTVSSVKIEKESFPPKLCSTHTPSSLCIAEYFVKGTEPTESSKRFATLDAPSGGSASVSGNTITLTWNGIATPDAINSKELEEHFNKYYGKNASQYYKKRLSYNESVLGSLGYEISLKTSSGESKLGSTTSTSYIYTAPSGGEYKFVIRSAYSKYSANRSDGLIITATVNSTPIVPTPESTEPTNDSTNSATENNTTAPVNDDGLSD